MTEINCSIEDLLKDSYLDFNRYSTGQLKIIGYDQYQNSDTVVKNIMSYREWLETCNSYPTIKVEGLEELDELKSKFSSINIKNVHLFITQFSGYSFDWHCDDVEVFLYVIKGKKQVMFSDAEVILEKGSGITIPLGVSHKVYSEANTWALSIGY
jgi:mannose-6-phosphate isomerase-like protein (cupin superfamily)